MSETKKAYFLTDDSFETRKKLSAAKASKLDSGKVLEIIALLKQGVKRKEIADKFSVSRASIDNISNGKSWLTVTGGPITIGSQKDSSEMEIKL